MMKHIYSLFLLCFLFYSGILFAQKGKNGPLIVSSTVIVNEYTSLSANATAGSTVLTVVSSSLNTHSRFSASLSAGDLVMVIQIQGATIKGKPDSVNPYIATPNDSSWGAVLNYNNCGNNDIREVSSVPNDTTIILSCVLANNYTSAGKVQVVRIPRYSSLTINNGGTITCDPWDSVVGGIVAIEDAGNTIINSGGQINASYLGFRGGVLLNSYAIAHDVSYFTSNQPDTNGAFKGESIAGNGNDYNLYGGSVCRGAPANGGGGGESWNSGGGGGANAGKISGWINGFGIPDTSQPGYTTAWKLEYSWMPDFHGSGGGRGGYTWSSLDHSPLVEGPDSSNWHGDNRMNVGGRGGRPLDYSTGRLFLGGGGGAGSEDNNDGGAGGNGGGMIYFISYGTISVNGMVISNGQSGGNDLYVDGDGPGGAGAGGTIIVNSAGNISGITIEADGGTGGDQLIGTGNNEAEGPGGGGGGGYIATTNSVMEYDSGGFNGITTSFPAFLPNGATKGGNGIITLLPRDSIAITIKDTIFCLGDSVHFSGFAFFYPSGGIYTWAWLFPGGSPSASSLQNPAVYYGSSGTYTVSLMASSCSGGIDSMKKNFTVTINTAPKPVFTSTSPKCKGFIDTIKVSGGGAYTWSNGSKDSTYITGDVNADSTIYVTIKDNSGCIVKDSFKVTIKNPPGVTIPKPLITCLDSLTVLKAKPTGTGPFTYLWSPGGQTNDSIIVKDTAYTYSLTVSNGCVTNETVKVIPPVPATPVAACCDKVIIAGDDTILVASGNGIIKYKWEDTNGVVCLNPPLCSSVKVTPTVTTTYTVIGTDSSGCFSENIVTIIVETPCFKFIIPNVFTPNYAGPEGVDNLFYINNINVTSWSTIIYDRWGKEMFNTTNPTQYWNGTTKEGGSAPDGVYYYIINATCQGKTYKKDGFVQVIR
jgi:gliding motility-associated-like protein